MSCDQPDTITEINQAMADAIAAQEAGDFRAAERRARTAWMLISSIPDSELQEERLRWNRESLGNIVKELSRLAQQQPSDGSGRGALIRPIHVEYTRG
jgi:hypothetical protein